MQIMLLHIPFAKQLFPLVVAMLLLGNMIHAQTNYITNGSASANDNNCFILTPDAQGQVGSVWYRNYLSLEASFDFTFQVYLGSNMQGADGIAFVLQPLSTATGGSGNSLGYGGISPSINIEYDTYTNQDNRNDPLFDHISIQRDGNASHFAGGGTLAGPVSAIASQATIKDSKFHNTRITWDARTKVLSVYFDGLLRVEYTADLVANIFSGNPNVYWGFTGSTGLYSNLQQFCVTSTVFQEVQPLAVIISSSNVSCYGANDGSATATFKGGTPPYTFLGWSNGAKTQTISNLAPGTYTASVRDANGTTASHSVTITQPTAPVITCPSNISANTDVGTLLASYPLQTNALEESGRFGPINLLGNSPPSIDGGVCVNGVYVGNGGSNSQDVQTPQISSLTPTNFNISLDFKLNAIPSSAAPVILAGPLYRWLGIYMNSQGKVGIKYNNFNTVYSTTTLTVGQWYNAQLIFNNGAVQLIINGAVLLSQQIGALTSASDYIFTTTDFSNATALNGCIRNLKVSNGSAAGCAAKVSYSSPVLSDSCRGLTVEQSAGFASGSIFPVGTTTNTFRVKDASGNVISTCSFTVTVVDNLLPIIPVLADATINNVPGQPYANNILATPVPIDNCGIASIVSNAPSTFSIGSHTVTWTATDINGNISTATQNVIVIDWEAPVITCNAAITKANDAGKCGAIINYSLVANDNSSVNTATISAGCGDGSLEFNVPSSKNVSNINFVTSSAYADIAHGHGQNNIISVEIFNPQTSAWIQIKTIQTGNGDYHFGGTSISFSPVSEVTKIRFSSTETVHCAFHFYQLKVNLKSLAVTQTKGLPSGALFPIGTTTNTFVATDSSGNTATCSFTVTVTDTAKPVITGIPTNIVTSTATGKTKARVDWVVPTVTDNCSPTVLRTTHLPGDSFPIGITKVTYTATDSSSNTATASFIITVKDNEPPSIIPPADILVNNDKGQCGATIDIGTPQTTDNSAIAYVVNNHPSTTYPVGITIVTWTIKDAYGNLAIATQKVTVKDAEKPIMVGLPLNIIQTNDAGICGAKVTWTPPYATDNCSVVSLTSNHRPDSIFLPGVYTVTYTATDAHSNVVTGTFKVTVTDNEAPKAITKNISVILSGGSASITAESINNGSNDNCGGALSFSVSKSSFNCTNIGTNTVLLSVTDIRGNTSTAPATVTIVGEAITSSINPVPSDNTYTGGIPTNIYIGYGPQSVTLNLAAPGATAIVWTGGVLNCYNCASPVFTATAPGTFTFTATATNSYGCTTTSTVSICVRDIRVPGTTNKVYLCDVPTSSGNAQTITLSVNSVSTHLSNNPEDRLGSCDMAPCTISTSPITNTQQTKPGEAIAADDDTSVNSLSVKVSPNPTRDAFTIWITSRNTSIVNIRILDALGKVVEGERNAVIGKAIKLGSKLTSGTYYAEIIQGNERRVVKLIKIVY